MPDGPAVTLLDGPDENCRHNVFNGLAWGRRVGATRGSTQDPWLLAHAERIDPETAVGGSNPHRVHGAIPLAPGSIAFWDNRATAHLAIPDAGHLDYDRVLYRVTLEGDVPRGVDGRESEPVSGEPFFGS